MRASRKLGVTGLPATGVSVGTATKMIVISMCIDRYKCFRKQFQVYFIDIQEVNLKSFLFWSCFFPSYDAPLSRKHHELLNGVCATTSALTAPRLGGW